MEHNRENILASAGLQAGSGSVGTLAPLRKSRSRGVARGLLRAELGFPLSVRDVLLHEQSALSQLEREHPSRLGPTSLDGRSCSVRHVHVVAIAPSPDAALLAIATSDARVEIHQPSDHAFSWLGSNSSPPSPDTLRLSLVPPSANIGLIRASDVAWFPHHDTVALAMKSCAAVWTYDIETCAEDRPTRVHNLSPATPRGVANLATMAGNGLIVAAAEDCHVSMLDRRARHPIAEFSAPSTNNSIATAESLIYVCGGGWIRAYDVRNLPQKSSSTRSKYIAFENQSKSPSAVCKMQIRHARPGFEESLSPVSSDFNFVEALQGGARVGFQLMDGSVGLADLTTASLECSPENFSSNIAPVEAVARTGLYSLGARQAAADAYPWFVARRRGCFVTGSCNRGWRIVAPCVSRPAFRVVPLGLSNPAISHNSYLLRKEFYLDTPIHVSCALANDSLTRVVVGYASNCVDVFQSRTFGDKCDAANVNEK